MPDNYTIQIPCKKNVKAYLESSCGIPVNLIFLPELYHEFKNCLNKQPHIEKSIPTTFYSEIVTIIIPSDCFYRTGWEMDRDNIYKLNKMAESRMKFVMRQYVMLGNSLGVPISTCISEFQEKFGFQEQAWPAESIKKELYRNGGKVKIKTIDALRSEIRITLLAYSGIISKKLLLKNK